LEAKKKEKGRIEKEDGERKCKETSVN